MAGSLPERPDSSRSSHTGAGRRREISPRKAIRVFENLKAVLEAAQDHRFERVVAKATVYLTDLREFAPMNRSLRHLFHI